LIPSICLYRYSSAISRFLGGGGATELGNALAYQKSFWVYVGILILISMMVAILGILAAVFTPSLLMFLDRDDNQQFKLYLQDQDVLEEFMRKKWKIIFFIFP
jgi:hypothetical protein